MSTKTLMCHPWRHVPPADPPCCTRSARANHGFARLLLDRYFGDQTRCATALARAYMAVSVADSASSIAFSAKAIAS